MSNLRTVNFIYDESVFFFKIRYFRCPFCNEFHRSGSFRKHFRTKCKCGAVLKTATRKKCFTARFISKIDDYIIVEAWR